jgi:hypothetical protein
MPLKPMKFPTLFLSLIATGSAITAALPGLATSFPQPQTSPALPQQLAGLWRAIDIAEDVDDVLDGDFGQIDPVREVTEDVGDALDDVNDTLYDVTHINIYEPFTDIDDTVEDFTDDVDDTMRHISNDVNDWFD